MSKDNEDNGELDPRLKGSRTQAWISQQNKWEDKEAAAAAGRKGQEVRARNRKAKSDLERLLDDKVENLGKLGDKLRQFDPVSAMLALGFIYEKNEDYDKAIDAYNKAAPYIKPKLTSSQVQQTTVNYDGLSLSELETLQSLNTALELVQSGVTATLYLQNKGLGRFSEYSEEELSEAIGQLNDRAVS